MHERSKSMSAALGPPRLPTRKTRLRRCGTGPYCRPHSRRSTRANWLSSVRQQTNIPQSSRASSRHPKSLPLLLDRHPGTFSQSTYLGLAPPDARTRSRIARTYSYMSPDAPSRPSLFPAMEKDWQGLPPIRTSTAPYRSWNSPQSISLTSPRLGTSGNLHASTADGNSSTSANASGCHPSADHATLAASTPLKRLTYLIRPSSSSSSLPARSPADKHRRRTSGTSCAA